MGHPEDEQRGFPDVERHPGVPRPSGRGPPRSRRRRTNGLPSPSPFPCSRPPVSSITPRRAGHPSRSARATRLVVSASSPDLAGRGLAGGRRGVDVRGGRVRRVLSEQLRAGLGHDEDEDEPAPVVVLHHGPQGRAPPPLHAVSDRADRHGPGLRGQPSEQGEFGRGRTASPPDPASRSVSGPIRRSAPVGCPRRRAPGWTFIGSLVAHLRCLDWDGTPACECHGVAVDRWSAAARPIRRRRRTGGLRKRGRVG